MIDEKKIKREIDALLVKEESNSPQENLLQGFMEYINRQPVINIREAYFRQRMACLMKVMGLNVVVEVE